MTISFTVYISSIFAKASVKSADAILRYFVADERKFYEYALVPGKSGGKDVVFSSYGYDISCSEELAYLY